MFTNNKFIKLVGHIKCTTTNIYLIKISSLRLINFDDFHLIITSMSY